MGLTILVARDCSFCPGVSRAFKITEKALFGQRVKVYSVGPLIHNPEVVNRLAMLGLEVIDPDEGPLPDLEGISVIVRSHGIDAATEEKLRDLGAVVVDATCPTVKLAQEAARDLASAGYPVLLVGSRSHPEVRAILGRAGAPVTVIESADEARDWLEAEGRGAVKAGILCQTTVGREVFEEVVATLSPRVKEIAVRDTICDAVARRRDEAVELAGKVDLMLVVGGRNSSNTAQLAGICGATGVPTRLIEGSSEIETDWLDGIETVGVTGGASTPDWLIEEAVERLRELADD